MGRTWVGIVLIASASLPELIMGVRAVMLFDLPTCGRQYFRRVQVTQEALFFAWDVLAIAAVYLYSVVVLYMLR